MLIVSRSLGAEPRPPAAHVKSVIMVCKMVLYIGERGEIGEKELIRRHRQRGQRRIIKYIL